MSSSVAKRSYLRCSTPSDKVLSAESLYGMLVSMHTRIDYLADKYCFTELNESPRLRLQWQDVLEECRQTEAGPEERLRIALLNVDYVTSFELPFRLLLTRTPQMIAALREEWDVSQKNVVFNDKRFGCVYSLKTSLSGVPDTFRYHLSHRIRRVVANENTSSPYQQIAREVKAHGERLKYALETGLQVTALDGLFWFGSQRIAADVLRLRKYGMRIATASVDVYDNITGTTRHIPVYYS